MYTPNVPLEQRLRCFAILDPLEFETPYYHTITSLVTLLFEKASLGLLAWNFLNAIHTTHSEKRLLLQTFHSPRRDDKG